MGMIQDCCGQSWTVFGVNTFTMRFFIMFAVKSRSIKRKVDHIRNIGRSRWYRGFCGWRVVTLQRIIEELS